MCRGWFGDVIYLLQDGKLRNNCKHRCAKKLLVLFEIYIVEEDNAFSIRRIFWVSIPSFRLDHESFMEECKHKVGHDKLGHNLYKAAELSHSILGGSAIKRPKVHYVICACVFSVSCFSSRVGDSKTRHRRRNLLHVLPILFKEC